MSFSKVIISILIFITLVFTGIVLYIFYCVGSEPMVLIGAFFAFVTGELALMASIKKKKKLKRKERIATMTTDLIIQIEQSESHY